MHGRQPFARGARSFTACFATLPIAPMGKPKASASSKLVSSHGKKKPNAWATPVAPDASRRDEEKIRVLFRRDTDGQVDRAVRSKLGMFPRQQVDQNMVGGRTIRDVVKAEVLRLRPAKKYVSLKFWKKIVIDFGLNGTLADSLAPPTESEVVSKELEAALALAHDENPAQRSSEKLVRWLEWAPPLNKTELYGLLTGSIESPSMSAKTSEMLLLAVVKFMARTKAHEYVPDYWDIMRDTFDQLLGRAWKKALRHNIPRPNFLKGNRDTLALFIDIDKAMAIEKAVKEGKDPGNGLVEAMLDSKVGSELFAAEALKSEYIAFIADIERRIYELEYHNFEAAELASFRKIMMTSVESMCDDHVNTMDSKTHDVRYLDSLVSCAISNLNDEWGWRLQARYKTIAVSNGLVSRLPWETLLFGKGGHISSVPETVVVPESLLVDIQNCREVALKLLGSAWQSVASMQATIKSHAQSLQNLDKSFWMDIAFLDSCFDARIGSHFKAQVLDVLPKAGERKDIVKCIDEARTISQSDGVEAAGKTLQRELTGLVNLLQDCSEGRSPSAMEVVRMSGFSTIFLKGCENLCVAYAVVADGMTKKKVEKFGQDAINYKYQMCLDAENVASRDPLDLRDFRRFQWMLSAEQMKNVELWHREAMVEAKTRLLDKRRAALNDGCVEDDATAKGVADVGKATARPNSATVGAGASSASSLAPPPACAEVAKPKQPKAKVQKVGDSGKPVAGLARFFGPKALL